MALSLVDCVRVNQATYGWSSVAFTVDGQATDSIVSLDFDEELEARPVYSNNTAGPPLGWSQGRYRIAVFPLRMLTDAAARFKSYLATKAALQAPVTTAYGQAIFALTLHLASRDAGDFTPSTTIFTSCRVLGEKRVHQEGINASVTEFRIGCLLIEQDGVTLWDALPPLVPGSLGFPAVDTITVGGLPAPGKWSLVHADKEFSWQIQKAWGSSGATVYPLGDELVEPEFMVELWDPADFVLFKAFRATFLENAIVSVAGAPVGMALGIDHPELKAHGVSAVVPKKVGVLVNDGYGVWGCRVTFLQWRPPVPAKPRPTAAIPDLIAPTPTAQSAVQRENQLLEARLASLPD